MLALIMDARASTTAVHLAMFVPDAAVPGPADDEHPAVRQRRSRLQGTVAVVAKNT